MRTRNALLVHLGWLLVASPSVSAGNPDLYDYDVPASFIHGLAIEMNGSIGADLNDDGFPDNALGGFLTTLTNLEPDLDPNTPLAESIEDGSLALGCAWPTLGDDVTDAADVDLHFFNLVDTDANPLSRAEYRVDRGSFAEGTKDPLIQFNDGTIVAGELSVGPAQFALPLSLGVIDLPIVIERARIEGAVGVDQHGVTLTGGTLAGAIPVLTLLEAVNGFLLSDSCSCLGLDEPPINLETLTCNPGLDGGACSGDQDLCGTFADFCALLLLSFLSAADLDLDGDGEFDALSAFIHVDMQGTVLLGATGPHDCNDNGVPDDQDIAEMTSADVNGDGIPDECVSPGTPFHRGDTDDSGGLELTDGILIFRYLFVAGSPTPTCLETADTDNNGNIELTDGVAVLRFLFQTFTPPAPPGPPGEACGLDPDPPDSKGDLGCDAYDHC